MFRVTLSSPKLRTWEKARFVFSMAASTGFLTPSPSSLFTKITSATIPKPFIPYAHLQPLFNFRYPKFTCFPLSSPTRFRAVLAVVDEETVAVEDNVDENEEDIYASAQKSTNRSRPCELYVCNLPRSYDIPELLEMFKPFGAIISVEVRLLVLISYFF